MNARVFNPFEELKSKSILETLGLLPRVFVFVLRSAPVLFLVSNSTALVNAGIAALLLFLGGVVIDRVVNSAGTEFSWLFVLAPLFFILGVRIFQSLIFAVDNLVQFLVGERVNNGASVALLEKAASLDLAFYESPQFYDRLYQAHQNMYRLRSALNNTINLVRQSFTLIAMFGLLSKLHPLAILLLAATTTPRVLFEGYSAKRRFELNLEYTRNYRITDYFQSLLLKRENIKELRVFGLSEYFVGRFLHYRELLIQALKRLLIHFLKLETSLDALSMVGLVILWIFAVHQAAHGFISVGDLFVVFGAAQSSRMAIQGLFNSGGQIFENALFLTRFFELLDLDPQTVKGALAPPPARPVTKFPRLSKGIEFRNVSFHYPGNTDMVLKDLSFEIKPRTRLAVVGENGAGKTTLIKLLTRFYDPVNGSITIDGVDYREYDLIDVRRNITVVFQDFVRYDVSVSDNIAIGQVDYLSDRQRVMNSARKGGAHQMISKLPSQYDTMLGRTYDEGIDLSGGEWQNLAISRAFMSDAQLFVLDEPTAALDAFKEAELFNRFATLTQDRTVVFVSHRFSTVRMSDQIVVVDAGAIIENGSHSELMKIDGKYRQMFEAQASRYQ